MKIETIVDGQEQVFKLHFHHNYNTPPAPDPRLLTKTNIKVRTECIITDEKGEVPYAAGTSYCHEHDNFVKAIGRKIALTKALKTFTQNISREEARRIRGEFWDQYHLFSNGTIFRGNNGLGEQ